MVATAHILDDLTGRSACVRFEEGEEDEEDCRNKIKENKQNKRL